jgi:DNA-binding response OmpR family regulator
MLPGKDGFAVLNGMRAEDHLTGSVLTASQIDDRVTAHDHGADDYLVKPLISANSRRVRRCFGARGHNHDAAAVGRFILDQVSRCATVAGRGQTDAARNPPFSVYVRRRKFQQGGTA